MENQGKRCSLTPLEAEMLESLKNLARYEAFSDKSWWPAVQKAGEVIAKAEGRAV